MKCEDCKTDIDVSLQECPFASEIHDDHSLVALCNNCAIKRAEDI